MEALESGYFADPSAQWDPVEPVEEVGVRPLEAADIGDIAMTPEVFDDPQMQSQPRPEAIEESPEEQPMLDSLGELLKRSRDYPLLTAPQETDLAKRIERGDLAAKDRMVNSNIRLVVKNMRHYRGHG